MGHEIIYISVIICTYRRPESLALALESLTRQSWQRGGWELVIVENDLQPSSAVAAVVSGFKLRLPLKWCLEKNIGLSRARNRGIRESSGVYVAFLDDDAEALGGWLETQMISCQLHEPDFCGGPFYALFRDPKPFWYREEYGAGYLYGDETRLLKPGEYLGGGNSSVRKDLVLSLGGYREDLGMSGNKVAYCEDTLLMMAAWHANPNLKVLYLPDFAIMHEVRPIKMTILWQLKSWWAGGRDSAQTDNARYSYLKVVRMLFYNLRLFLLKLPSLVIVLFCDLFRPNKTLWRRYLKDNMQGIIYSFSKELHRLTVR